MTTNETQNPTAVIGYDPGFGNIKVCIDGRVGMIQSAASQPKLVGLATIGMRAASQQCPLSRSATPPLLLGRARGRLVAPGSSRLIWMANTAQISRWP